MSGAFEYADGILSASGVPLDALAEEFGTPLYVYSRQAIKERIAEVISAFSSHPTRICYSVKANSNHHLLKWISDQQLGFDVVSGGELRRLLMAGIPVSRTVFAGVGKGDEELKLALDSDIWMVTVESAVEAQRLSQIVRAGGRETTRIGLRLNLDIDARTHRHITTGRKEDKFGIESDGLPELISWLADQSELEPICLHMHLGSQITSVDPYVEGVGRLLEIREIFQEAGFNISWINAGGGFGISYEEDTVPAAAQYAASILPLISGLETGLILALVRYLVGSSGCLITRVLDRKYRNMRKLIIADSGMTELMRPALYEAYHKIVTVEKADDPDTTLCDVAGPICESTDMLGWQRILPDLKLGDLLAVMDTGAYGMSMASNYNSRCRPAEVMITGKGEYELIRRRERPEDLWSSELNL